MTLKKMNIEPGIGIGPIKYGITEEELISILGKPDKIDIREYIKGSGDWSRDLWYMARNVHFTFNKDDDYRLGRITILGSGYPLFGRDLFALPQETVKYFLVKATKEIPRLENWPTRDGKTHAGLWHDGLGIVFWFDSGDLSEMQCRYLFESDNETVVWP